MKFATLFCLLGVASAYIETESFPTYEQDENLV